MNINKITRKIEQYAQQEYEAGKEEGWHDGYGDGYQGGILQHKETMTFRMNLYYDSCMAADKFREAKWAKELIEYLEFEFTPDVLENLDND
jgi:flagellar biosynthesis/type III secretory pathway protein FliH